MRRRSASVLREAVAVAVVLVAAVALTGCGSSSGTSGGSAKAAATGHGSSGAFSLASIRRNAKLAGEVPSAIRSSGTLTVGSDTTYPPYEFIGADGTTPQGIDVDVAKGIARTLGLKLDFETANFDSILPAIGTKYDLGISAFTITKARYAAVDFISYFNAGKQWGIQRGNPSHFNPHDVCGTKVGVVTGSTDAAAVQQMSAACVHRGKKAVTVVSLPQQTDIATRLVAGALNATLAGSTNIQYASRQTDGRIVTIGPITQPAPDGIAVKRGDTAWARVIAGALNAMIKDGDFGRILARWGVQQGAVSRAAVNPQHGIAASS
jgi:polar amino acid transport system substrate-binding protein